MFNTLNLIKSLFSTLNKTTHPLVVNAPRKASLNAATQSLNLVEETMSAQFDSKNCNPSIEIKVPDGHQELLEPYLVSQYGISITKSNPDARYPIDYKITKESFQQLLKGIIMGMSEAKQEIWSSQIEKLVESQFNSSDELDAGKILSSLDEKEPNGLSDAECIMARAIALSQFFQRPREIDREILFKHLYFDREAITPSLRNGCLDNRTSDILLLEDYPHRMIQIHLYPRQIDRPLEQLHHSHKFDITIYPLTSNFRHDIYSEAYDPKSMFYRTTVVQDENGSYSKVDSDHTVSHYVLDARICNSSHCICLDAQAFHSIIPTQQTDTSVSLPSYIAVFTRSENPNIQAKSLATEKGTMVFTTKTIDNVNLLEEYYKSSIYPLLIR
jgi:hypothetical protein